MASVVTGARPCVGMTKLSCLGPLRTLGLSVLMGTIGCQDPEKHSDSFVPPPAASPAASAPSAEPESPRKTGSGQEWTFDDAKAGKLPAGFAAKEGTWAVATDETAPSGQHVLAQTAQSARPTFNVVLVSDTPARNVDLRVKLRAVAGRIDQGGGLVWRAKDGENYYIARYNPLEDNFRAYKVVDGKRQQLASADVKIAHEAWHDLRVVIRGDHIEGYLNGKKHLDVRDTTFAEPGHIGLWTKADAQTHFDDVTSTPLSTPLDPGAIQRALGTKISTTADGVVRATWSRDEVPVKIDGMPFPPVAGLTSWAGFMAAPNGAMLMGDTVVFQDEVSAAMDAAFAHDLEITALHNHFFYDEPKVYFMHIGGHGEPEALARGVRTVWDAIRRVREKSELPATSFPGEAPKPDGTLKAAAISKEIGQEATEKDGVVKVTIAREASMHGAAFGGSMGLTTWAAFIGSDDSAAMDGDFAMTAAEVQPVLRALRKAGIFVVALHNHMIGEEPAYYFTHFWGKGPALQLARGFRLALDAQAEAEKHP